MTIDMPYSRNAKATGRGRFALAASALALLTVATASCSVVDDAVSVKAASSDADTVRTRVISSGTSYGYQKSGNDAVRLVADASVVPDVAQPTYSGSSPYICSPSGFGQKARCFLRP